LLLDDATFALALHFAAEIDADSIPNWLFEIGDCCNIVKMVKLRYDY
jgi:hypothetical protein